MIRYTHCCGYRKQRKQNNGSVPKETKDSGGIYDHVEDNFCYQELGEFPKPTFYDIMAQRS